ncbi:MAG: DUF1801 domain-containing protein [Calditrichaceae bacterium]
MEPIVKQKFNLYPAHVKSKMESLRSLIFDTAKTTDGVGELEETLKWNEPAYLPSQTKSGTTIRIDWKSKQPDIIGMYVSCNTTLVSAYRSLFGNDNNVSFEGNRAVTFPVEKSIPKQQLKVCIRMALRYHLDQNI